MRLIDSDTDVYLYVETWTCNCSEYGIQNVMAVDDVSTLPEIDPETLPIVRELRAQLTKVTSERDAAIEQLHGNCPACKNYTPNHCEGPCANCTYEYYAIHLGVNAEDKWEWRGPKKEE